MRYGTSDGSHRFVIRAGKPAKKMHYWALVFLLVAIVAGALGFAGVAVAFAAKIIFFSLLVSLVVSLVAHVRP